MRRIEDKYLIGGCYAKLWCLAFNNQLRLLHEWPELILDLGDPLFSRKFNLVAQLTMSEHWFKNAKNASTTIWVLALSVF